MTKTIPQLDPLVGALDFDSLMEISIPGGGSRKLALSSLVGRVAMSLTASQINHLNSTPQTVPITAPGAGKAIIPLSVEWYNHVGSIFTGGGNADAGNVIMSYNAATGLVIVGDAGTFESEVPSFMVVPVFSGRYGNGPMNAASSPPGGGNIPRPFTDIENQQIVISNSVEDYVLYGAITTSGVTSGNAGLLYAAGDTGSIAGSYGPLDSTNRATYVVDTVDGGGAVLTYHLDFAGKGGYKVVTGNETEVGGSQPGAGSGFEIDINSITPGNGNGLVIVDFEIVTLP